MRPEKLAASAVRAVTSPPRPACWEDSRPDRYPCGCNGTPHWHPEPDIRVTAYWYAAHHGLPCDLDYLLEFGAQAARRARWLGIGEQKMQEGPLIVHTWPEFVFDQVMRARQQPAAPQQPQFYPPGSWAEAAHPARSA
jgi:hypothetical protein